MVFLTSSALVQKGSIHKEGREQTRANIAYYENARIIEGLESIIGLTVYGGVDAPYIWLKTPGNMTSWGIRHLARTSSNRIYHPGSGFWPSWVKVTFV